jgi:hypothetical protein
MKVREREREREREITNTKIQQNSKQAREGNRERAWGGMSLKWVARPLDKVPILAHDWLAWLICFLNSEPHILGHVPAPGSTPKISAGCSQLLPYGSTQFGGAH